MKVETSELYVARRAFPGGLLGDLQDLAHSQVERKHHFDLATDCPDPILHAAEHLARTVGASMNTAILKRYRLDDVKPSGAYAPHPDPDSFAGEQIELCSLDGEAMFFVETTEGVEEIECYENTLVVMNPSLQHWVTPPQNDEGERHLLFFGLDSSRPATI